MNRRDLLAAIACLPFCWWLKPKPIKIQIAAIGVDADGSSLGSNAILYAEDGSVYIARRALRNIHVCEFATASDFESLELQPRKVAPFSIQG